MNSQKVIKLNETDRVTLTFATSYNFGLGVAFGNMNNRKKNAFALYYITLGLVFITLEVEYRKKYNENKS